MTFRADAVADADGWLVGRIMRGEAVSLGEAWRRVLVAHPSWQQRWDAFIAGRFGSNPFPTLVSCFTHFFTTGGAIGYARDRFVQSDDLPVGAAVTVAADAFATAMIQVSSRSIDL